MAANPLRGLPPVQRLLESSESKALIARHGRDAVTVALRVELQQVRERISDGRLASPPDEGAIIEAADAALSQRARPGLRRVINATGIVLHTNLGRAPLAPEALAAVADVTRGYSNLELDLSTGTRGSRTASLEPLLCEVTGAEAALAVNNGAAAILLALSALAGGGEVVVSRGELVEIGGGFRIPDVIRQGAARLVEVGTTNKTRIADYRDAIGPETRVLLKVHQSNFRTIGFTAETGIAELMPLARAQGLMVVADLGSGLVSGLPGSIEPTLHEALAAGADLVTCSGDKLLGGPQAGLVLGRKDAIDRLRNHPLLRAVRLDKMMLAALEATLILHRDRSEAIPVNRMLRQSGDDLHQRASRLLALLGQGEIVASEAQAGGGALPEERIASTALALDPPGGCDTLAARLRAGRSAVIGRIHKDRLLLDMLTVADEELANLAEAVRIAMP